MFPFQISVDSQVALQPRVQKAIPMVVVKDTMIVEGKSSGCMRHYETTSTVPVRNVIRRSKEQRIELIVL